MKYLLIAISLSSALLTGCSETNPEPSSESIACASGSLTESDRLQRGTNSGVPGADRLPWTALLKCAPQSLVSSTMRVALEAATATVVAAHPDYKRGVYASLLKGSPYIGQASEFSSLALNLEESALVRRSLVACEPKSREIVIALSELDYPFTVAVLGEQVAVPTAEAAKLLATTLFSIVAKTVAAEKDLPCDDKLKKTFEQQAASVLLFVQGKHPLTPHCKVDVADHDMALQCSASTQGK